MTIPMGFGATLAPAQLATATCQSAILLSPQGRRSVWIGLRDELTGSGTMKSQTTAHVSNLTNSNSVLIYFQPLICHRPLGVQCQKAELVDLSERPDVERYDWDGTNVDFEVQVQ